MQITPSTFSSGLNALQAGQRQVDQAAAAMANPNSISTTQAPAAITTPSATANASRDSSDAASRPELSESLVALRVGEHQAQAGAKLVQTADEALGTLINTRA